MKNTATDSLLKDLFEAMPKNMADFNDSHQEKVEQLLKIDNKDFRTTLIRFSPRSRRDMTFE
jgi:hypothetical protein